MCGRYTYRLTWEEIVRLYRLTLPDEPPEKLKPSYNVAPTDVMPIVRPAGNGRELLMAGWGLVPYWLRPDQLGKPAYATRAPIACRRRRPIASPTASGAAWCRRAAGTNGRR
jgi:putative SOS response-associated peptidase YedK